MILEEPRFQKPKRKPARQLQDAKAHGLITGPGRVAFGKLGIDGVALGASDHVLAAQLSDQAQLTVVETFAQKFRELSPHIVALRSDATAACPPNRVTLDRI
jgi:hypothetical protein